MSSLESLQLEVVLQCPLVQVLTIRDQIYPLERGSEIKLMSLAAHLVEQNLQEKEEEKRSNLTANLIF